MPTLTPFQKVQKLHGSKEQLVEKIVAVLDHGEESKDDLKRRLATCSNSKLLRLLDTATEVKERFGSKERLVDAILRLMKRHRDADYRRKLLTYSPARLLDIHRSRERTAKTASLD